MVSRMHVTGYDRNGIDISVDAIVLVGDDIDLYNACLIYFESLNVDGIYCHRDEVVFSVPGSISCGEIASDLDNKFRRFKEKWSELLVLRDVVSALTKK